MRSERKLPRLRLPTQGFNFSVNQYQTKVQVSALPLYICRHVRGARQANQESSVSCKASADGLSLL